MSYPVYYPEAGDVLPHLFNTYAGSTGASITLTGLAVTDIEIYKDGSTTQRSSDAGYTLLDTDGIDFDGLTGIHGFSIDLGDNTDSGFFAVGSWYHVVVSAVTVDSQTVSFIACAFRIVSATRGLAGTALPDAAADAAGGLPISDAGGLDLDARIGTDIPAILADTGTDGVVVAAGSKTGYSLTAVTGLGNQTADITGNLSGSVGSVTGSVGSVTGSVGSVTGSVGSVTGAVGSVTGGVGGNVAGSIGSLAAQAKADVNAEVLDVFNVDTFAQPGQEAPAATTTLANMLKYLYKSWRNRKDQTSSQYSLYADDASTVDQKATVSDDGTTTTIGEIGSGP